MIQQQIKRRLWDVREQADTKQEKKTFQALGQWCRALKAPAEGWLLALGLSASGNTATEIRRQSMLARPGLILTSGTFPLGLAGVAAPVAVSLAVS